MVAPSKIWTFLRDHSMAFFLINYSEHRSVAVHWGLNLSFLPILGSLNAVVDTLGNLTPTTSGSTPGSLTSPISNSATCYVIGSSENDDDLPEGWEARSTLSGRVYFVNHFTRTSHWERPTTSANNTAMTSSMTSQSNNNSSSQFDTSLGNWFEKRLWLQAFTVGIWILDYSGDLNSEPVWYSNSPKQFFCWMGLIQTMFWIAN